MADLAHTSRVASSARSETIRLAPALLELYADRVMLSSRELTEIVRLESSGVPTPQILSWARELYSSRRGARLSMILQQLAQRVQRWRASHVGDQYEQERETHLSPSKLTEAVEELVAKLQRAEAELHEPKLKSALAWVTDRVLETSRRALLAPQHPEHLDPSILFERLASLNQEFRERISLALPLDLQQRVQAKVQKQLEREANRARPQDFILAQRAVYWLLLSNELGLPSVHLSIFDQW